MVSFIGRLLKYYGTPMYPVLALHNARTAWIAFVYVTVNVSNQGMCIFPENFRKYTRSLI